MSEINKIKVGILPCMADLYNKLFKPDCIEELKQFASSLPGAIGSELAQFEVGGLSSTQEQISAEAAKLAANGIDMLIIMLAPYCPSGAIVPAVTESKIPVLLWPAQTMYELDAQTFGPAQINLNHGVHAVQDIANVLRKQGKPFGILHRHYLEADFREEFEQWVKAAKAYTAFVKSNPIQVGGHFVNMFDLQIADAQFICDCGIKMTSYDLCGLKAQLELISDSEISMRVKDYENEFVISCDVSDEMLKTTARGELAIEAMMTKADSKACGINFQTLCNASDIGDAMHIAASRLMAKGKGYAGEGDWVTAAFIYAMQSALGAASFSEIFSVDYKGGRVLLKHWGEANTVMARQKAGMLKSQFNEDNKAQFCVADMEFMPGAATLINLNADPQGMGQLISIFGEIADDPMPNLPGPRALFKPQCPDIHKVLDDYAYNGGSHHIALVYGCAGGMLTKLSKLTGWSYLSL